MNNDNSITVETKLFGYIAENAQSARYAVTLNALFKTHAINAMMIPMNIRPDDLTFTVSQMRHSKLNGALIGSEYQEETFALLDVSSPESEAAGYCDFITIAENRLFGDLITPDALETHADHPEIRDDIAMHCVCYYLFEHITGVKL